MSQTPAIRLKFGLTWHTVVLTVSLAFFCGVLGNAVWSWISGVGRIQENVAHGVADDGKSGASLIRKNTVELTSLDVKKLSDELQAEMAKKFESKTKEFDDWVKDQINGVSGLNESMHALRNGLTDKTTAFKKEITELQRQISEIRTLLTAEKVTSTVGADTIESLSRKLLQKLEALAIGLTTQYDLEANEINTFKSTLCKIAESYGQADGSGGAEDTHDDGE